MAHKRSKMKTTTLMKRSGPKKGIQHRQSVDLQVREIKAEERRATVSFSSEQAYERWYGVEILQHDKGSVDLKRLQNIGVALWNHDRNVVIGRIENVKLDVDEKRAYCDIVFDDDEESEKVFKKVQSGTLKGVSVGYRVDVWEEIAAGKQSSNGRFTGPAYVATKWTPFEVSIVSIPADDSVGVGRDDEDITNPYVQNNECKRGETKMTLQELCQLYGLDYAALVGKGLTDEQIRAELSRKIQERSAAPAPAMAPEAASPVVDAKSVIAAEQKRILDIDAICRENNISDEMKKEFIKKGFTVEQVGLKVLDQLRAANPALPANQASIRVGEAEEDKIREAAVDGLLMRAGMPVEKPAAGAKDFRGLGYRDLAIECLTRAGVPNAHLMDSDSLFRAALTPDSQLSIIFTDSVNKSMAIAYKVYSPSCDIWCGVGSNRDFKAGYHYQISEGGDLSLVSQTGELKFDEPSDQYVSKKVETRGKKFGFTRQGLINDDLDVISKIPMKQVRAALRQKNKLVYSILGNNQNITYVNNKGVSTTKALFHTDHKNIQSNGGAPSTTTLKAARAAMRTQTDIKGIERLNLSPKFLIVPAALETDAEQLVGSLADPNGAHANVVNPWKNLRPVADAELDGLTSGSTGWFTACDPMDCETIEITYLNGNQSPILQSQVGNGIDYLGVLWSIIYDYGITALDFRGLYFNDGTPST